MTLLERVQAAGNVPCAVDSDMQRPSLEMLKDRVQGTVSADVIASIMAENPERARNEIRSACKQAFQDELWVAVPADERARLVEEVIDAVFGLGPIEGLLADAEVTEIMVNGSKSIYFERDGVLQRSGQTFANDDQVRALIDRIIGPLGRRIDEASPMVSARLPQGHRVHAIIPPLAVDGPMLTIRTFTKRVMTLDDMMASGSLDERMRQFLVWAVLARKSMAVSGGTGSGKTTLLNALSCHVPESERIITIEDAAELRFLEHPHVIRLEARPRNAEGLGEVTIRDLVANALRMRPDRIIVGECRGGEALDMLQAMNTGHDGSLTTLHANAPAEAIDRLITMVRYAVDLPVDVIEAHIANALDLIVQTSRSIDGKRFISDVAAVSFDRAQRACETKALFKREDPASQGIWLDEPAWIDGLVRKGLATSKEVSQWKLTSRLAA